MIKITKFKEEHLAGLKKMMLMENLDFNEISLCLETLFIVEERTDVLGFGYYNVYQDDVFIDHLYIRVNERLNKLGDSLFRTILNALNLQGVDVVKMRNLELYQSFLLAEAIEQSDKETFLIDLNEFFNRKCRSEKATKTPLN